MKRFLFVLCFLSFTTNPLLLGMEEKQQVDLSTQGHIKTEDPTEPVAHSGRDKQESTPRAPTRRNRCPKCECDVFCSCIKERCDDCCSDIGKVCDHCCSCIEEDGDEIDCNFICINCGAFCKCGILTIKIGFIKIYCCCNLCCQCLPSICCCGCGFGRCLAGLLEQ